MVVGDAGNAGIPTWTALACRRRAASIWASLSPAGAGRADLQSLDFAGPAFAFGFGNAVVDVAADPLQPGALSCVWPQERVLTANLRATDSNNI